MLQLETLGEYLKHSKNEIKSYKFIDKIIVCFCIFYVNVGLLPTFGNHLHAHIILLIEGWSYGSSLSSPFYWNAYAKASR